MKTTNLMKMSLMRMNLQFKIYILSYKVGVLLDNNFVSR